MVMVHDYRWIGCMLLLMVEGQYVVEYCSSKTRSTGDPSLDWCAWRATPSSSEIDIPSSTQNDNGGWITPLPVSFPFFDLPDFVGGIDSGADAAQHVYGTSNGFLSLTPYLPCPQYCSEFWGAVRWPLIAVYDIDLNPETARTRGRCVTYSNFSDGVNSAMVWSIENVPLRVPRDPMMINTTAQAEVWSNGTIILRYGSVPGPPSKSNSLSAIAGLFLPPLVQIGIDPPQWVIPIPSNATAVPDAAELSFYAVRLDREIDRCRNSTTCEACTADPECAWCSGTGPSGRCFNTTQYQITGACARDSLFYQTCLMSESLWSSTGGNGSFSLCGDTCADASYSTNLAPGVDSVTIDNQNWTAIAPDVPLPLPFAWTGFQATTPFEGHFFHVDGSSGSVVMTSATNGTTEPSFVRITPLGNAPWTPGAALFAERLSSSSLTCSKTACKSILVRFASFNLSWVSCDITLEIWDVGAVSIYYRWCGASDGAASVFIVSDTENIAVNLVTLGSSTGTVAQLTNPISYREMAPRTINVLLKQNCPLCLNSGRCNQTSGTCQCPIGYNGTQCTSCAAGYYELNGVCALCPICNNGGRCGSNGECRCPEGFSGPRCEFSCSGPATCSIDVCNTSNGYCECDRCVCQSGWSGQECTDTVSEVTFAWSTVTVTASFCAVVVSLATLHRLRRYCKKSYCNSQEHLESHSRVHSEVLTPIEMLNAVCPPPKPKKMLTTHDTERMFLANSNTTVRTIQHITEAFPWL